MATITNNRCTNPSFENAITVGDGTGAYANGGSATVTVVTGDAKATGDDCVEITASTANQGTQIVVVDTVVGASVIGFDHWHVADGANWAYVLYNIAFTELVASTPFTSTVAKQRIEIPFVTASNPTQLFLYISRAASTAGTIRVDAFRVGEDSGYFDGDTTDTPTDVYAWTGVAGQSASTRTFTPASGYGRIRSQFELRPY
jgi:hypothetical protein